MQTWLPFVDFKDSALVLDSTRLRAQRLQAKQIIMELEGKLPNMRWRHHPVVKLWEGHCDTLALYGLMMCSEWRRRGYHEPNIAFFAVRIPRRCIVPPAWLGDAHFHLDHQARLMRLAPKHYGRFFTERSLS